MRISVTCILPILSLSSAGIAQVIPDCKGLTGLAVNGISSRARQTFGIANLKTSSSIPTTPTARKSSRTSISTRTSSSTTSVVDEDDTDDNDHDDDHDVVSMAIAQASTRWAMTSSLIPTVRTSYSIFPTTVGSSVFRVTRSTLLPSVFTKFFITSFPVATPVASTSTVFVDPPDTSSTSQSSPTRTGRRTRTTTLESTVSSTSTIWGVSPTTPSSTQTLVIVHDPTSSATSSSTVVYVVTPVVNSTSTIVKTVSTATLVLTPTPASSVAESTSTLWVDPTQSVPTGSLIPSISTSTTTVEPSGSTSTMTVEPSGSTLTTTAEPSGPTSTTTAEPSGSTSTVTVQPLEPTFTTSSRPPIVIVTSTSGSTYLVTVTDGPRKTITPSDSTLTVTAFRSTVFASLSDPTYTEKPTSNRATRETLTVTVSGPRPILTTVVTSTRPLSTSLPWNSTNPTSKAVNSVIVVTMSPTSSFASTSTTTGSSTTTWTSATTGTSTTSWTSTTTFSKEGAPKKQESTPVLPPKVFGTGLPEAGSNERLNPGTNNRPLGKVRGSINGKSVTYPNKHGSSDCKMLGKKCMVADSQPVRPCFQVLREHIYKIHVEQPSKRFGAREKIACAPDSTEYCAFIEWEPWTPEGMAHSRVLNEMQQPEVVDGKIPILAIVEAINWIKRGGAKLCGQTLLPVAEARIPGNGTTPMQVGRYVLKVNVKEPGLKDV